MPGRVPLAFDPEGVVLPLPKILPLKKLSHEAKQSRTYRRIEASIREVGLIEPLVVYPVKGSKEGLYSLLEGHTRFEILRDMGWKEVLCLVATEDESYTYHHKVSVVSPIQEHFMILKAVENGVSEERIAKALDVNVSSIRQKRDLLKGICDDAVELLRDKQQASQEALRLLRKVKPMRQIAMAELMVAACNYSAPYVKLLLASTQQEDLVEPETPKEVRQIKPDDLARIENEVNTLGRDLKMREDSYGKNMLHLSLAVTYLRKWLANAAVVRYLTQHHADLLGQLKRVVESSPADGPA